VNGDEPVERLKTLIKKGGEFLLIRREPFCWLEDSRELKEYLDCQYRIIQDDEICRIYDLHGMTSEKPLRYDSKLSSESQISR
jgi:hypothetical protein